MQPSPLPLSARYHDGRSARAHAVLLRLEPGILHIAGEGIDRRIPWAEVQWPERTRHGVRVAHLRDGGSVQCPDAAAWDAWARAGGRGDTWVVRVQQSWRWVAAAVLALLLLGVALQRWGIPLASRAVVAALPMSLDQSLGQGVLRWIDGQWMRPSKLPPTTQQRLQAAVVQALGPAGRADPPWTLVFRDSRIGPNALALPGGTLILTDQLVELVAEDTDVIAAVLAHELGHVRRRHGARMLVQVTLLGTLSALVLGDFSTVLASAPVMLGQAGYSRDAEREADAYAVRTLRAAGISPAAMVRLFDKLAEQRAQQASKSGAPRDEDPRTAILGIAFASHPPDAERVRFFKDAATGL